jgi:hypothetical protein
VELLNPSESAKVEATRAVPALAGGESYTTIFRTPTPEGETKIMLSRLIVDSEKIIHELKEDNNEWSFAPKNNSKTASTQATRGSYAPSYALSPPTGHKSKIRELNKQQPLIQPVAEVVRDERALRSH